jgi:hypothetical protein
MALVEASSAELTAALAQLRSDMRPIVELPEERRRDAEVRNYVVETAVRRLGEPVIELAVGLCRREGGDEAALPSRRAVTPVVRAALAGAAAVHRTSMELQGEPLRDALDVALVAAADAVLALAEQRDRKPATHAGLARRLSALLQALSARGAPPAPPSPPHAAAP